MFYSPPGLRQEFQSNPDATWNCWNLRKSFRGSPVKISSFGIIHESGPASLLGHTAANYSEETDATFQAQSDMDPAYPIDKAALLFLTVNKRAPADNHVCIKTHERRRDPAGSQAVCPR